MINLDKLQTAIAHVAEIDNAIRTGDVMDVYTMQIPVNKEHDSDLKVKLVLEAARAYLETQRQPSVSHDARKSALYSWPGQFNPDDFPEAKNNLATLKWLWSNWDIIHSLLTAPSCDDSGWLPIDSAPRDGTPLAGYRTIRYLPYKPEGKRQMKADGRWQECNGYGWENCKEPPEHYQPLPPAPMEGE